MLKDAGIEVMLSGVQMPRMNAVMERRVLTCRRELLDRTLIWNHQHLLHALREFEQFYDCHRPHQGIANARPLRALPDTASEAGRRFRPWLRGRSPGRSVSCSGSDVISMPSPWATSGARSGR